VLGVGYSNYTRILVPEGDTYLVINNDQAGTSQDTVRLYYYPAGAGAHRGGPPIPCAGLAAVRNTDNERIRTVIPRACLGNPADVRTGALMHTFVASGHARMDDARRNADVVPTDATRIRVGASVGYN
jgi:hypothetical protein